MPIKYELGSITEFMTFEEQIGFVAAVEDIYGIDLSLGKKEPFLKGIVHHGEY